MSSHQAYDANNALAEFARRGARNIHGWGIGSYADRSARIPRSEAPATDHEEWLPFDRLSNRKAKMLVFSGPTLVVNADVPK
jgi:predicted glutamine amidotransferase